MKSALWLTTSFVIVFLASCSTPPPRLSHADIGPGIGPFDANGNYREDWADDPSKWRRPSSMARNDSPPPDANPLPRPSTNTSGGSRTTASTSPPPRSTPSVSRPTPPKPAVTRYTVRRGDTLSAIANRYGSSIAAIRKANGISGHLIHPGQRLVIPRR